MEYLVLACEEGGRWGPDQFRLVRDLVRLKVAPIHPLLRRSAALAYTRRWWHILSIGAQTVAADCILGHDSPIPTPDTDLPLASVLTLAEIAPAPSRMAQARSEACSRQSRPRYLQLPIKAYLTVLLMI